MAELFTVAKMWTQAKCPWGINWQRKRHIHTMEYYSALRKKGILPFVSLWSGRQGQ